MKWIKNKTEYKIGIYSFLLFSIIGILGLIFGFSTFPAGYIQKIAFAGLSVSIFWILAWFIMEKSRPFLKEFIDPDTIIQNLKECTAFQKILLGSLYFALLFWGFVQMASQL